VSIVAKAKRSVLNDIAERVGELLKDLETLVNPRPRRPALVPIPVRNDDKPRRKNNPYR
jgi:hypothetical protein